MYFIKDGEDINDIWFLHIYINYNENNFIQIIFNYILLIILLSYNQLDRVRCNFRFVKT